MESRSKVLFSAKNSTMIRSRKRRLPRAAVLPLDDSVEENAGSKLCSNTDKYLETLKETLLKEYRNVAQRLRIKDLPKCLLNPAHCAQAHFRNKVRATPAGVRGKNSLITD